MTEKQLMTKARRLAQRFYEDAQALFDDEGMSQALADDPVFAALQCAQGYAQEAAEADS